MCIYELVELKNKFRLEYFLKRAPLASVTFIDYVPFRVEKK